LSEIAISAGIMSNFKKPDKEPRAFSPRGPDDEQASNEIRTILSVLHRRR